MVTTEGRSAAPSTRRQWHLLARPAVLVLVGQAAVVGGWASLAPLSFYRDFPASAAGLTWVLGDGPYNEHLMRDVGILFLALLVATVGSVLRGAVRAAGVGWVVASWLHLGYHAAHLQGLDREDAATSLGALVVVALAATDLAWRRPRLVYRMEH